jgi:hypothetical protein
MQACENNTLHALNKTIDDGPMYMCVCLLRILITKDKVLPFSNYNVGIYNFLAYFPIKASEAYEITSLSVCVSP